MMSQISTGFCTILLKLQEAWIIYSCVDVSFMSLGDWLLSNIKFAALTVPNPCGIAETHKDRQSFMRHISVEYYENQCTDN